MTAFVDCYDCPLVLVLVLLMMSMGPGDLGAVVHWLTTAGAGALNHSFSPMPLLLWMMGDWRIMAEFYLMVAEPLQEWICLDAQEVEVEEVEK